MPTFRQAVSDIINDLHSYNLDDRYSFRFLANKLRDNISTFLKQDSDLRALFNLNYIWKAIPSVSLIDAGDDVDSEFYQHTKVLKRSRKKLPTAYTGRAGAFLKVLNVNNTNEYKQIKSFEYKDIVRREFRNRNIHYFWIEDGYLYIPDLEIETVRVMGLFINSQEADEFGGNCDSCSKPLDSEILAPDYIIDLAKKQVINELVQINKRVVPDERPNENVNQKV